MTCRDILSLLDDFIDNDLSPEQSAQVHVHLKGCDACRTEYGRAARINSLLRDDSVPEPPGEYWTEVTSIIQARTVDSVPLIRERIAEEKSTGRRVLIRSLAVFAASAVLLATTLLVSHNQPERAVTFDQTPVYVTAHIADQMNRPSNDYLSRQDQARIAGGTLVVGAPSMVSRYSSLAGMPLTY